MASKARKGWTFLTNHAAVLFAIYEGPDLRLRDIAERVGITERAAHQIVSDLVAEGYITVERVGRRNHYSVSPDLPIRHPAWAGSDLMDALKLLLRNRKRKSRR